MRHGSTQRDQTLEMLTEAGDAGVTNGAFIARRITRFSARIDELRKDGYEIQTTKETAGRWRYTLVSEPKGKLAHVADYLEDEPRHYDEWLRWA